MSDDPGSFFAGLRRYPAAMAGVVLALGFAIAAWFLNGRIDGLRSVLEERSREGEAMLSLLVGASIQRQELAFARETARRIEDNLIAENNLAENTWYFFKLEEQTGARVPELRQLNPPQADRSPRYKRIPYTLRVAGSHEQVAAFLRSLETGPRLISVTAFNLSRVDRSGDLSLELSVEALGKR
jgi:hypothetical protein